MKKNPFRFVALLTAWGILSSSKQNKWVAWCLPAFLILFFLKVVYLAVFVTLPWDISDEIGHLGYVKHIASGEGLPLFQETRMDEEMWRSMVGETGPPADFNWIAQHPPLYYTLMVPAYWVGSLFGDSFEGPLYAVRVCNALLMVVALVLVNQLARRFLENDLLAFCLTVMAGSIPLISQTAAGANNDTLIVLVSVALAIRWLCFSETTSAKNLLLAGAAIGLCGITKYTLLLIMAPVSALVLWRFVQERGFQLKPILGFVALGWLPLGIWIVRNITLSGKPMPTALDHLVFELSTNYSLVEFFRVYPFFTHSFRSFWGIWGWHGSGQDLILATLHLPASHQFLYAALLAGLAILSLHLLYAHFRKEKMDWAPQALIAASFVTVCVYFGSLFPHEAFYVTWLLYITVFSLVYILVLGVPGLWLTRHPIVSDRHRIQMESILVAAFFLMMVIRQMHAYSNEGGALRGTHGRYYFAAIGILLMAWVLPALQQFRHRNYALILIATLMVLAEFWLMLDEIVPFLNRDV